MSSAAPLPEPQGAAVLTPPARARGRLSVFVGQAWAGDRRVGRVGQVGQMSADSEEEPGGRATVSLLLHPGPTRHRRSVRPPEAPLVHPDSLIKKIPIQRGQEMVPTGPPDGRRRALCSF